MLISVIYVLKFYYFTIYSNMEMTVYVRTISLLSTFHNFIPFGNHNTLKIQFLYLHIIFIAAFFYLPYQYMTKQLYPATEHYFGGSLKCKATSAHRTILYGIKYPGRAKIKYCHALLAKQQRQIQRGRGWGGVSRNTSFPVTQIFWTNLINVLYRIHHKLSHNLPST